MHVNVGCVHGYRFVSRTHQKARREIWDAPGALPTRRKQQALFCIIHRTCAAAMRGSAMSSGRIARAVEEPPSTSERGPATAEPLAEAPLPPIDAVLVDEIFKRMSGSPQAGAITRDAFSAYLAIAGKDEDEIERAWQNLAGDDGRGVVRREAVESFIEAHPTVHELRQRQKAEERRRQPNANSRRRSVSFSRSISFSALGGRSTSRSALSSGQVVDMIFQRVASSPHATELTRAEFVQFLVANGKTVDEIVSAWRTIAGANEREAVTREALGAWVHSLPQYSGDVGTSYRAGSADGDGGGIADKSHDRQQAQSQLLQQEPSLQRQAPAQQAPSPPAPSQQQQQLKSRRSFSFSRLRGSVSCRRARLEAPAPASSVSSHADASPGLATATARSVHKVAKRNAHAETERWRGLQPQVSPHIREQTTPTQIPQQQLPWQAFAAHAPPTPQALPSQQQPSSEPHAPYASRGNGDINEPLDRSPSLQSQLPLGGVGAGGRTRRDRQRRPSLLQDEIDAFINLRPLPGGPLVSTEVVLLVSPLPGSSHRAHSPSPQALDSERTPSKIQTPKETELEDGEATDGGTTDAAAAVNAFRKEKVDEGAPFTLSEASERAASRAVVTLLRSRLERTSLLSSKSGAAGRRFGMLVQLRLGASALAISAPLFDLDDQRLENDDGNGRADGMLGQTSSANASTIHLARLEFGARAPAAAPRAELFGQPLLAFHFNAQLLLHIDTR